MVDRFYESFQPESLEEKVFCQDSTVCAVSRCTDHGLAVCRRHEFKVHSSGLTFCMSKSEPRKVHIAEVKVIRNGVTYASEYLRRTFREDGTVKQETSGKLIDLSQDLIELIRQRSAQVELLCRSMKSFDLHVRPICHFKDDRIRTHVCSLNTVCLEPGGAQFNQLTQATPLQRPVFAVLGTLKQSPELCISMGWPRRIIPRNF